MIFVWSGRGFLLIIVWIAAAFISIKLPGTTGFYPSAIASFVTAIFAWFFGNKWNNKEGRIVIDERTGERLEIKSNHSFFWIKMQYWSPLFSLLGLFFLFQESGLLALITGILTCGLFTYAFMGRNKKQDNRTIIEQATAEETFEERHMAEETKIEKEDPSRFMPQ